MAEAVASPAIGGYKLVRHLRRDQLDPEAQTPCAAVSP
jgi:hypothetical protein